MKTMKTTAAVSRLLGSLLFLCCLTTAPAMADDAGVAGVVAPAPAGAPAPAPAPVVGAPAPAPAPPQVTPTGLQNFSDQLLAVLVPVFVTFVGALGVLILNKVKSKLHLDVSDQTALQWESLAKSAALRGAEWARQKAKELTEGKKVPGPEVMDVAVNWATDMAVWQKLPALARVKLEGLIESELFKLRQQDELAKVSIAMGANETALDISKLSNI